VSETTLSAEVEAEVAGWISVLRADHCDAYTVENDNDAPCPLFGGTDPCGMCREALEYAIINHLAHALERSARIEAERDAAHDAIRWALGEGDSDFGDDLHDGAFWWRKPLRDKAGLVWSAGRCRSVTPDELLDRAALNDRDDG
jgi:hypothetical protein